MLVHLLTSDAVSVADVRTSSHGTFQFAQIPGGAYQLVTDPALGFSPDTIAFTIQDNITNLKLTLSLAAVNETVNVESDDNLSTSASANKDAVSFSGSQLESLPIFDQDYIAALTPFLDASSIGTKGVTIIVDGLEMTSTGVSPSAIQNVRINTDPYSAESNRPGRGRIEVTTKPGSPEFHGTFNFTYRDTSLNATNYFANTKPPDQRRIYEGYFTGPIGHGGHTTFLISGNRKEEDLAASVFAAGPAGPITGNVLTPSRSSMAAGRIAHDFSENNRVSLQYDSYLNSLTNQGVGSLVLSEAGYNTYSREDDFIFIDRLIVSPAFVNQLQIALQKNEDNTWSVTLGPSLVVQGAFTSGSAQADLHRTENTIRLNEIVTLIHGRHYIRFGPNIPNFGRRTTEDHTNRDGTYQFASLAAYQASTPFLYTIQQGPGRSVYWYNEIGGFVQDEITFSKRLQASIGLRYDWQTYLNDNNNLAPRGSLAYSVGKEKTTILRAGTGLFYDRTGGDSLGEYLVHNGTILRSYQVENPAYPATCATTTTQACASAPPGLVLSTLPSNITVFSSQIHAPYTIQYSVDAERKLGRTATVSIGYRGSIGIGIFRERDANAPTAPAYGARPNSSLGAVDTIESEGRQLVNAMDISFNGRLGRWFVGQAQYTLGRTMNNTSGINFFPQNQYNPSDEWGRADQDSLQRLNMLGNVNPGHWLTLGVGLTLYSGTPYTELAGADTYHTGLDNARPTGIGRNTLHAGGTADLDLRWSHDIALTKARGPNAKIFTVNIDGFNVLNHTNYTSYVGSINSPLYQQPTAALAARQLQFTARFKF